MTGRARKRFGQNFLTDARVISQIVATIGPQPGEVIVEIGPGRGALTRPLLESGADLHALEIDRDLANALTSELATDDRLAVHPCDALQADPGEIAGGRPYRLVGNLPYNISTPLLFHVLGLAQPPRDMHFMLQSEVVGRLAADPGNKAYGRLSVMCQNRCAVTPLFEIAPEAFSPRPQVQSGFVRLVPHTEPRSGTDLEQPLDKVVRAAFSKRRKTLRNSMHPLLSATAIEAAGIDPGLRAEQLEIDQFIALARQVG